MTLTYKKIRDLEGQRTAKKQYDTGLAFRLLFLVTKYAWKFSKFKLNVLSM